MGNRISAAAMVHTENGLGPELAKFVFDPENISDLREFALEAKNRKDDLAQQPSVLTIGGRVYDSLRILRGDEKVVPGGGWHRSS